MKKIKENDSLKTIVVFGLFFVILALFTKKDLWLYFSAGILFLGLFDNILARFIAFVWLSFGDFLGLIMSKVVLFLIFYLVLTPMALFWRLFNKEAASHFLSGKRNSFFYDHNVAADKKYFEKTW